MADNGIARVYQFLGNRYANMEEWKKDVDENFGNGDGTVIKTEARSYLLNEFDWEIDDKKDDIINKFWSSLDSNTVGKVGITKLSNKNAIDGEEIERANEIMKATESIDNFMLNDTKVKSDLAELEASGKVSNLSGWKQSVKTSLLNKAIEFIQKNKTNTIENWDISAAYQLSCRQATADYAASSVIEKDKDLNIENYYPSDDASLKKIIDSYVKNLATDSTTPLSTIISDVEELVEAYVDTAKTNSQASVDKLGSAYNANGRLNDLQKAVLTNSITDAITAKLENEYKELYSSFGTQIDAKIAPFISEQLKNAKARDFVSIKENISSYVDKFFASELAEIQTEYNNVVKAKEELENAKSELKGLLSDKYNTKYKEAISAAFGKDTQAEVEQIIDGYQSIDDLNKAKSVYEAKVQEIDARIDADDFFKGVKDEYSVLTSSSMTIATLPSSYGAHSVGTLSFTPDSGMVSVDSSGNVIVKAGDTAGQITNITISVIDKTTKNVLATKVIKTINIVDIANDNTHKSGIDDYTISGLINNNNFVAKTLCSDVGGADNGKVEAISAISSYIQKISAALQSAYPQNKEHIKKVEKTTLNFYTALIRSADVGSKNSGSMSASFSYENAVTSQTVSESATYSHKSCNKNNGVDTVDEVAAGGGTDLNTGLYIGVDQDSGWNGSDDIYIYVDLRMVMKKFLSFM